MLSFVKDFYQDSLELDERKNKAIAAIALIGAIAAWLALPAYLLAEYLTGETQYQNLANNNLVLAIGLSLAYILARLKIKLIPTLLTALLVQVTFVTANIYIEGLGITLGIVLLAIVINIAIQGLTARPATIMVITAVIAASICILIDIFNLASNRTLSPAWLQQVVLVMGGLVVLFVSINLLKSLELNSVQTQITLAFFVIAIVPLATVLASVFLTQTHDLREIQAKSLQQTTFLLADEINLQLRTLTQKLENETKLPVIEQYQNTRETDVLETLRILSSQNQSILSYGLLNLQGNTILDTLPFYIGENQSNAAWFQETISRQTGYISEIVYDENLVRPVFYVSAPIFNDSQEIIGVLRAQYDSDFLRNILSQRINRLDPSFAAIIVEQNGIIISHTAQPSLQLKTLSTLSNEQVSALQSTGQLPAGTAQSLSAELPELFASLKNKPAGGDIFSAPLEKETDTKAGFATATIIGKSWLLIGRQTETFDLLNLIESNLQIITIAVAILFAVVIVATNTSGLITAPINTLSLIAREVGKGNLNISSGINRKDEFGTLARAFDETTGQLRSLLKNLEARVAERTSELGQVNELVTQRAEQLKATSAVALAVNKLQNLQILLPQITEEISKAFDVYHVGIFLIDPSGQYAILQAANSEGGKKMLARGHRLRVGQVGIVGYVTGLGKTRIALDVGDDATFFNNPDLPQTRSEVALPLKSGNTLLGALDLQSEKATAFSQEDIEALSLLADQISTAIQNARLFEETQSALNDAQLIFSKNVQSNWRDILSLEKSAFRFANGVVLEINPDEKVQEGDEQGLLELPIVMRGEKLGVLKIKRQTQQEWNEQDIRILQSIVDRIGFALENARLFRNAQRLVSKEQLIGDISDKISRSVNLESILQTAVEELGHVISDSEVTIQVGEHESLES